MVTTDSQPVDSHVVEHAGSPRSYIVVTPSGDLRRNRSQLNVVTFRDYSNEPSRRIW